MCLCRKEADQRMAAPIGGVLVGLFDIKSYVAWIDRHDSLRSMAKSD